MKITLLLTQSLESPGGAGRYWPMAKALTSRGHQVTIIALHHDIKTLSNRRLTKEGVNIIYASQMHVRKVGNEKYYYHPLALIWISCLATWRLFLASLRTPADLIHVGKTQPMNGLAAWGVHLLTGRPVFLDSDDYETINNRFSARWQQQVVAWFENWLPSFAAGITAGTTFIANRYVALGFPADQLQLVPNGVDRQRFARPNKAEIDASIATLRQDLQIPASGRIIVYVGSMSLTSHAVDLLLEAFSKVVKQCPQALLLLVGGGEDIHYLKQLAEQLHITAQLRFIGRVPPAKIPLYFSMGEMTVDPMRQSTAAESSLSLKLIESIAAGIPCITADIGDRKRLVGRAGTAVQPDDAAALATAMIALLNDPSQLAKMRQAAVETGPAHWWEKRIVLVTDLYDRCLPQNQT